jgi:beta-mannosidase
MRPVRLGAAAGCVHTPIGFDLAAHGDDMMRTRILQFLLLSLAAAQAAGVGVRKGAESMRDVSLNGTWKVRQEPLALIGEAGLEKVRTERDGWMPAQVPGEIHLDLMKAGLMGDPNVGINALADRWPETKSWWYETSFEVDSGFLQMERQDLVFDGLDLYAQVFVNGKLVGEAADAFIPHSFDVRRLIHEGKNDLAVRMTVGTELSLDDSPPGQGQTPHKPAFGEIPNPAKPGDVYGHRNWYGRKWLRKPQASYGWDWQEALPNVGIWRGVHLCGRSYAVLHDIRLDTLEARGKVSLELAAMVDNLHPWSERACALDLSIQPPDGGKAIERRYPVDALPGRNPLRDVIPVPNPKLWWPNGMGEQPLYEVTAKVVDAKGVVCDERKFHIGLRTIDIDRRKLSDGTRFCVRVNGRDVFCRGGNLAPHDMIPARLTDAKYEALVSEAKNAHMTMFRINGVSIFEGQAFYDACDRAGILIMHDFPFTCATYPDYDAGFREAVRVEIDSAVRSLRHHPSIAIWSGGNECIWGMKDWYNGDGSKPLDIGGSRLYNEVLPDVCNADDPHRPYWPGSPCGGEDPNSETSGDCHWWGAYLSRDPQRRISQEAFDDCRARFVSEWGFPGPCHLDSIREYLSPEQMKPGDPAWETHTNQMVWDTLTLSINAFYTDADKLTLPEWVMYGQMCQADYYGHTMEALRFRKDDPACDCEGALIWSYSDCWGETGWSQLDYYLRRKASYYSVRRACAPVKVIVRRRAEKLVTRIVNDTLQPVTVNVEYGWWRVDGSAKDVKTRRVTVPADGMKEIGSAPEKAAGRDPKQWFYAAALRADDGTATDQSVWLLAPFRQLESGKPDVKVVRLPDGSLEVSSKTFAHGVHLDDHGHEVISDNWFDLLPGMPVRVTVEKGVDPGSVKLEAVGAK